MSLRRVLKGPGLHLAMLAVVLGLLAACSTPSAQELAPDDAPTAGPALAPPPPTPTPQPTITLVAVGDLMLARDLVTLMDRHGAMYPFEHVEPILSDADITVANLEGTFTDRGTAVDKKYVFRTPPRDAAGLALAGIDVVSEHRSRPTSPAETEAILNRTQRLAGDVGTP